MKKVNQFETLLIDVLSQQSESHKTEHFRAWLEEYIIVNIDDVITYNDNGNLYVQKGDANFFPCMVSHTDTVHSINKNVEVFKSGDWLFAFDTKRMVQYGIGGDDKVGVFMCLMLLHELPYFKCVFFRDEEVGCQGSALADIPFFADCCFVLQCDRRGNTDFINSINGLEMYGTEFAEAIKPILEAHGYKNDDGMMTDVETLKRRVNLCMANMSCGYYKPHTDTEVVCIVDVANCYVMCKKICIQLSYQQWVHEGKYTTRYYGGYGSGDWGEWDGAARAWNYNYNSSSKKMELNQGRLPMRSSSYTPTKTTEPASDVSKYGQWDAPKGFHWEYSNKEGWHLVNEKTGSKLSRRSTRKVLKHNGKEAPTAFTEQDNKSQTVIQKPSDQLILPKSMTSMFSDHVDVLKQALDNEEISISEHKCPICDGQTIFDPTAKDSYCFACADYLSTLNQVAH